MILLAFMAVILLGLAALSWICDQQDAHDDLKVNEYRLRCKAFHPSQTRFWE